MIISIFLRWMFRAARLAGPCALVVLGDAFLLCWWVKNGHGFPRLFGEMAKHFLRVPSDTYVNTAVKVKALESRIRRDG
jgi:hypothetical protein